jgi:hypothetical protein
MDLADALPFTNAGPAALHYVMQQGTVTSLTSMKGGLDGILHSPQGNVTALGDCNEWAGDVNKATKAASRPHEMAQANGRTGSRIFKQAGRQLCPGKTDWLSASLPPYNAIGRRYAESAPRKFEQLLTSASGLQSDNALLLPRCCIMTVCAIWLKTVVNDPIHSSATRPPKVVHMPVHSFG